MNNLHEKIAMAAGVAVQGQIKASEFSEIVQRQFLLVALRAYAGNVCHTAKAIGMHRNTLARQVVELKIDVRPIRQAGLVAARKKRAMSEINRRMVATLVVRPGVA